MTVHMTGTDDMDVFEQAADWFDRSSALDSAGLAELQAWLDADNSHAEAYAVIRQTMSDPALLDAALQGEFAAQAAPIVRPGLWDRIQSGLADWVSATWVAPAAVAALCVAIAVPVALQRGEGVGPVVAPRIEASLYSTRQGERASHELADATRMDLGAQTRLEVAYSDAARDIRILDGRALFDVTSDPSRRFTVEANGVRATALGTIFSVDRLAADVVEIRVSEGVVRVDDRAGRAHMVLAGEWVRVDPVNGLQRGQLGRQQDVTDWRWLDADNLALRHILSRLADYTDRPVRVADPALLDQPLSGRYPLNEPEETLRFVASILDVGLVETDEGWELQ